jgi:hypothetical protein
MLRCWETPGFEVLRVAGECTAYAGAGRAMPRPEAATRPASMPGTDGGPRVAGVSGPVVGNSGGAPSA